MTLWKKKTPGVAKTLKREAPGRNELSKFPESRAGPKVKVSCLGGRHEDGRRVVEFSNGRSMDIVE